MPDEGEAGSDYLKESHKDVANFKIEGMTCGACVEVSIFGGESEMCG
jgi:hypothetical protein